MSEQDRRAEGASTPKAAGERRRYNRRRPDVEAAPPYYEIFERIAGALEGIEQVVRSAPPRPPRPREGSQDTAGPGRARR